VQLIHGVEWQDLNASQFAHALLAALAMSGALGLYSARVAIAKRIGEWNSVGIDPHIVHGPAIDGDGANSLGGQVGTLA
jgi:hypothetical protein